MAITERTRFKQADIIQYVEWATPLGSITFEPSDNDYQSTKTEGRTFTAIIEDITSEEENTILTGDAKSIIKQINQLIKKEIEKYEN